MSYDHVELKIYVNGRPADARFTGIRGTIFPVVYGMYKPANILLAVALRLRSEKETNNISCITLTDLDALNAALYFTVRAAMLAWSWKL